MKTLLVALLASAPIFAQPACISVTDVIYSVGVSTPAVMNGTLDISLGYSATDGAFVVTQSAARLTITNGVLSVCLAPGNYASVYSVRRPAPLTGSVTSTRYWVIPSTGGPYTVAQVETSVAATPALTVALSQLGGGGATDGQIPIWSASQAQWLPGARGGGGAGGALCSATGGADNALVSACSPSPTAYAAGMSVSLKVDACPMTPGPTTINLNSLGVKDVYQNGAPLNAVVCVLDPGIGTGAIYSLTYDGARFNLPSATAYASSYSVIPDAAVASVTQGQLFSSTSPTNPPIDSTGMQITTNEADNASGGDPLGYLVGLAQTLTSSDSSTVPWHFVLGIQAAANAVSNVSQPAREVDGVYAVAASAEPNPILNLQGLYGKADNLTADVTGYVSGVSGYAQNTSPAAITGKLTGGYFYVPLSTSGGDNLGSALTASVLAGDTYCLNSTSCAGVWVTPVFCGTTSGDCVSIYAQGTTYPSLYAEGWTVHQGATFSVISARGANWENGSQDYCTDCKVTSSSNNTCVGSGSGAQVFRINGANKCMQ